MMYNERKVKRQQRIRKKYMQSMVRLLDTHGGKDGVITVSVSDGCAVNLSMEGTSGLLIRLMAVGLIQMMEQMCGPKGDKKKALNDFFELVRQMTTEMEGDDEQ